MSALRLAQGDLNHWIEPQPSKSRFIDVLQLLNLPQPKFLVEGLILEGSLATLYAPPGHAKSFFALDLALSVASGRDFFGRPTKPGAVIFVAAEGLPMMKNRVDAWMHSREVTELPGVRFDTGEWLLGGESAQGVAEFVEALDGVEGLGGPVRLIVIDTLAHALAGSDENSAADMGMAIQALRAIQRRTGAAILLVHHTGKKGPEERGSSALRGAMDTMLLLDKVGPLVTVSCTKQKDIAIGGPFILELAPTQESCVLIAPTPGRGAFAPMPGSAKHRLLNTLFDMDAGDGIPPSVWSRASGLPESSFYKLLKELDAGSYIAWTGTTSRKRYSVTGTGRELLTTNSNFAPR